MDIVPKLQMNLHPKDAIDRSLVYARNVKLSNDESCITNEEGVDVNKYIYDELYKYYTNFSIISIIPCNNELVLFVKDSSKFVSIWRYREKTLNHKEEIKRIRGFNYYGGTIKAAFTYNVENSLILAVAEYNGEKDVPLRTINLGNFDDDTIYSDVDVDDSKLSISPKVKIPSIKNLSYVDGNSYKGWYYFFIRYKINSVDYTQWFSFGRPVFVDSLEKFAVTKYCYAQTHGNTVSGAKAILYPKNPEDGYCSGATDNFSNTSDIANETFKFIINNIDNSYDIYQIGIVCTSKSYTKAFRSADVDIRSTTFVFNKSFLIEYSANDLISDNYNYFNVKNICNYKNRLYISNYKESNANVKIDDDIINNIKVHIVPSNDLNDVHLYENDLKLTVSIINNSKDDIFINQYEINSDGYDIISENTDSFVTLAQYFNINNDTPAKITGSTRTWTSSGSTTSSSTYYTTAKQLFFNKQNNTFKNIFYSGGGYLSVYYKTDNKTVEFYDNVTVTINGKDFKFNENDLIITYNKQYINPKSSFADRRINRTFIPGEIYNFFIHFVDEYGHCTNGYRLTNNVNYKAGGVNNIVPVSFLADDNNTILYAAFDLQTTVLNENGELNMPIGIYKYIEDSNTLSISTTSYDSHFKEVYGYFKDYEIYKNIYWYQIANGYGLYDFLPYINNNNNKLFRFPIYKKYLNDGQTCLDYLSKIGYAYNIVVDNIKIPEGYIGYFISYEKFETNKRATGFLTRADAVSKNTAFEPDPINNKKSNYMYFYSSCYDISDSIQLDYNFIQLIDVSNFYLWENKDSEEIPQRCNHFDFCYDRNKPQTYSDYYLYPRQYPMPINKLCVADSVSNNRQGLGTALRINDSFNLFPSPLFGGLFKNYKAILYNLDRNLYMSENKVLIRCSDIIYGSDYIQAESIYPNGCYTYDSCIIYNAHGFSFNTADNIAYRFKLNSKFYLSEAGTKAAGEANQGFMTYLQTICVDDYYHESKSFKNEPTGYVFYTRKSTTKEEDNRFQAGCIVTPANSIDLFENRQGSSDQFNIKTYTNYREDLVSVSEYNKTVRRSNVIQDESRINGWRTFPVEGYKNIAENKGNITNLIGIGTIFLVHTEHSLFMFDTSNTLETKDKSIQLSQPDAFDVDYKEVFTSELGYGGLQDGDAYIVDQFGYIFYNNDFNRFYIFDNGSLKTIDSDIIQWLNLVKPDKVRFGNDKFNNRLIISILYKYKDSYKQIYLTYNYSIKSFISINEYGIDVNFINTKNELYFTTKKFLSTFNHDNNSFNYFETLTFNEYHKQILTPVIGIVVNTNYDVIKFINSISYKLNKLSRGGDFEYTNATSELKILPYSGNLIRINNDVVDTGNINISITNEANKNIFVNYKKPYWELGKWNFSYLFNNIAKYEKYGNGFEMSRLYGNYFIIKFAFNGEDSRKIEFESLEVNMTK